MLEAQAVLTSSADGVMQKGDIIVVALPGHPWGSLDQVKLFVFKWQDDALEAQLMARRKAGEAYPVIAYPYATLTTVAKAGGERIMTRLSTKTLDLTAAQSDPTTVKAIADTTDYTLKVASTSLLSKTLSAVKTAWNWIKS